MGTGAAGLTAGRPEGAAPAPRPDCRGSPQSSPEAVTANEETHVPVASSLDLHAVGCRPGLTQRHEWGTGLPRGRVSMSVPAEKAPSVGPHGHISELTGEPGTMAGAPSKTPVGACPSRHQGNRGGVPFSRGLGGHTAWPPLSRSQPHHQPPRRGSADPARAPQAQPARSCLC